MKIKIFISSLVLAGFVDAPVLLVAKLPAERPPNFVFMLADDLGYRDLACYGHPYAKTPTLDKLAADGVQFHQNYSAICRLGYNVCVENHSFGQAMRASVSATVNGGIIVAFRARNSMTFQMIPRKAIIWLGNSRR